MKVEARVACECSCGCVEKGCSRHVSADWCWLCAEGTHHTRTWPLPPPPPVATAYELTPDELDTVDGFTRRVLARVTARRARDYFAPEESDYELKFRSFCAEYAASRLTGLEWHSAVELVHVNGHKVADIGSRTEVRNTPYRDGHLILRQSDVVEYLFLLMVGDVPVFRAAGWLAGQELMRFPIRVVRVPGHWAPQGSLRPLPLPSDA